MNTFIKINDTLYPAMISGRMVDSDWDGRASKSITLEMDYESVLSLFVYGLEWSIVMPQTVTTSRLDENGEPIYDTVEQTEEYDNSEYCVAGDITDHRDGTMTIKMGKLTELEEAYELMLGGIE